MFIELITNKGEALTFNARNIVLIVPERKGTMIVDVNGMDWHISESYENLKGVLQALDSDKNYKLV